MQLWINLKKQQILKDLAFKFIKWVIKDLRIRKYSATFKTWKYK